MDCNGVKIELNVNLFSMCFSPLWMFQSVISNTFPTHALFMIFMVDAIMIITFYRHFSTFSLFCSRLSIQNQINFVLNAFFSFALIRSNFNKFLVNFCTHNSPFAQFIFLHSHNFIYLFF